MYAQIRPFRLACCLALAGLAALACSQAGERSTEPIPTQEPAGGLLQDAPPTPPLETIEVDIDQAPPLDLGKFKTAGCPKVASPLGQIVQSPNPLETAKLLGARVHENKIQVLVVLEGEDVRFLGAYDVEVSKQSGTQVQAFAPLSRLCDLASSDGVLAIRLPDQAVGP